MKWLNQVTALAAAFAVAAMLATPQARSADEAAAQGEPPAEQPAQAAGEQDPPAARKLEIIELQHREPQQLTQLLGLWDQVALPSSGRGRAAVRRPSLEEQPEQRLAVALDNERKLMFLRGTAEQIEKIKALVAATDVADDALKPQDYADHRLIPVPGDSSGQIQSTLGQLDLAGQMLRVGETTFIAYKTDDEDGERLQQAEQVINKLAAQPSAEEKAQEQQAAESQAAEGQAEKGQAAEAAPAES